jgi:hypothetical protein
MGYYTKIDTECLKDFNIRVRIFHAVIQIKFVNDEGWFSGRVYNAEKGCVKVEFNKKYLDYATIFHESIHIASQISQMIGLPVNQDNEEFIAYVSDFVTGEIIKKIEKRKNV